MADLGNSEFNTVAIEDKASGADLKVYSNGSIDVNATLTSGTGAPSPSNISEWVALGRIYGYSGVLNTASAGVDNPLVWLRNPSGSGKTIYIYSLIYGIEIENNQGTYKIFSNPTVTANGTSETPRNQNIGGGFGASSMLVNTFPTVSSTGTLILAHHNGQNSNSVHMLKDFSVHIKPNNSILITGDPKSNNRASVITVIWGEK